MTNDMLIILAIFWYLSVLLYFFILINSRYKALAKWKGVPYRMKAMLEYFIVILPFIYVTVIISHIRKFKVKIALKRRYKEKFKGFLNGQDNLFVEKHPRQAVVPVLFLVRITGDPEEFYETTKQYLYNSLSNLTNCDKFFGTVESDKGYHYIRSSASHIDQYISKLRVISHKRYKLSRTDLLLFLEEYYAHSLPKFDKALWQVFIGTQAVSWHPQQKYRLYPIIFKFSHCLFNEKNFMKTLLGTISENKNLYQLASTPTQKSLCVLSKFKMVYEFFKYSYAGLPLAIVNSDLLKFKRNVLVGAELGTKKFFCVKDLDSRTYNLLKEVKSIKEKTKFKTSFSCIFETAIMASLSEFYRRYSYSYRKNQKNLVYVTTIVENGENFTDLELPDVKYEKSGTCKNDIRFMCLNSPLLELSVLDEPTELMSILEYISALKDFSQNYGEAEITRNVSGVYNYFPNLLQNLILTHRITPPTIVSSLNGPSSKIKINGHTVEDIYGWCPNFGKTGITFAICTYQDVAHVTLNADANLIGSNGDATALLDGVYKYIHVLHRYHIPN